MKVTINKIDSMVGIDGVFKRIELNELPANFRVLQWSGNTGHIEWTDGPNTTINSISNYQYIVNKWNDLIIDNQIDNQIDDTIEHWREITKCGPLQIRKALRATGLLQSVVQYIDSADEETKEAWEYASEFKRLDPFILSAKIALNKTDEEVDDIFRLALTF